MDDVVSQYCDLELDSVRDAQPMEADVGADPCTMNGFAVFYCPSPAAADPSLSADRYVPDTGGQPSANSFELWQESPDWPSALLSPTLYSQC